MDKIKNCPICNKEYSIKTIDLSGHVYRKIVVSEIRCDNCGMVIMTPGCNFDLSIKLWNSIRRNKNALYTNK